MSARRHEEILEECLSAYLEGRRSIEDSLSLYPSYAAELEPLLRAATSLNDALNQALPPAHVQQRGLDRFLSDARARRNLAALQLERKPSWSFGGAWQKYRLGLAGAALALLIAGASIGGAALLGSEGIGGREAAFQTQSKAPATPAAVINFQAALKTVKERGPAVQAADIVRLKQATQDLQKIPREEITPVLDTVTQQLAEASDVVSSVATVNPGVASQAEEARDVISNVASALVNATPGSDEATATPVTTEPGASASPGVEPTGVPTAPPTEAPALTAPPSTEPAVPTP